MDTEPKQRTVTEDDLIDYTLRVLYGNLDKNELHFERDILQPLNLQLNASQIEHLRELILSTQFVKASVGFGKNGNMYLTNSGIQFMKRYKSYTAWLRELEEQKDIPSFTPAGVQQQIQQDKQPGISNNYDDMAH